MTITGHKEQQRAGRVTSVPCGEGLPSEARQVTETSDRHQGCLEATLLMQLIYYFFAEMRIHRSSASRLLGSDVPVALHARALSFLKALVPQPVFGFQVGQQLFSQSHVYFFKYLRPGDFRTVTDIPP